MQKFTTIAAIALVAVATTSVVKAGSYDPFSVRSNNQIRSNNYVGARNIAYTKQCGPNGCYNVPVRNSAALYPQSRINTRLGYGSQYGYGNQDCPGCANGNCVDCRNGNCANCASCQNGQCRNGQCRNGQGTQCRNGQCTTCKNGVCRTYNQYGNQYGRNINRINRAPLANRFNARNNSRANLRLRGPVAPAQRHMTGYTPQYKPQPQRRPSLLNNLFGI